MPRQSKISPIAPPGFILGSAIDSKSWDSGTIATDTAGRIYCFVGYQREDQKSDLPYYSPSVGLRDLGGRKSFGFVKLSHGTLMRSSFLSDDEFYRIITNRRVDFPQGANSYFGIISQEEQEEDIALCHAIFGGTSEDIATLSVAVAKLTGRSHHEMARLPRLTFSKTKNNSCDLTNCLIPKNFPYIAFADSQYDWSHVSLHGFYRLICILCGNSSRSPAWQYLIEEGIQEDFLRKVVSYADGNAHPLMMRDFY